MWRSPTTSRGAYYPDDAARQAVGARYLRDNIQYFLGADEIEGLDVLPLRGELDLVDVRRRRCGSIDAEHRGSSLTRCGRASASAPTRRSSSIATRRLPLLGRLADGIRARKHPDGIVTYIIDRNVNYTNVCVAKCNFCAFYRPVGSPRGLRPRLRGALPEDRRDDRRRRRPAAAAGRTQSRPADEWSGSVPRDQRALPLLKALQQREHSVEVTEPRRQRGAARPW